jgi:PEP-CTERM/exosortase A-associated glycosyltransferase
VRVFHVLDHSLPHLSGYAIRSHNILKFQTEHGLEPYALTSPKQGNSRQSSERFENISYLRTNYTAPQGIWQKPYWNEFHLLRYIAREIRKKVDAFDPEILHAHSPVLNGWPAWVVAKRAKIPLVYEIRAFWEDAAVDHGTCGAGSVRYQATKTLETILMRRVGQVVTLSETMRQEIVSRGIDEEKVHVVPNAVDVNCFTAKPPRLELIEKYRLGPKRVIGFIGSFYHYEGLDILINAFEKIYEKFPQTCLLLVGDGFERQNLEGRASRSPARSAIVFTGAVSPNEVIDYYALMDILAYPRRKMRLTELVCPLKPLEAMALNKCIVGSNVGGIREFVVAGETGLLAQPDDADDLARTLCRLLASPDWCHQLGLNGRKAVLQKWAWSSVVQRYKAIYQLAQQTYKKKAREQIGYFRIA